jgi:hypothetical protein
MLTRAPIRIISTILVLASSACILEDAEQPAEELDELDELDMADPDVSRSSLDEQPGLDEIDSNEPEAVPASADPLQADFNGDGFADLAVGTPNEDLNGVSCGSVTVFYGSEDGLTTDGIELWSADSSGVGEAGSGDLFGIALAAGYFNGDNFADLAIGSPDDDVNGQINAGSVTILYGSCEGLTAENSQIWHRDSPNIDGDAEAQDHFGDALTTGDFNNDTFDDLAVGVPGLGFGLVVEAGAIYVIRGSDTGLTGIDSQFLHQDNTASNESAELSDAFGSTLAAGHFNGDEFEDLAIGSPGESFGDIQVGLVHALYGYTGGLFTGGSITDSPPGPQIWHQDIPGIDGISENGDGFGSALAAGDFDGDLVDDLAVGVPGEDVNSVNLGGAVNTIYGSDAGGLTATGDQYWTENTLGVLGVAEPVDTFGRSLAAADFDEDGHDDLAIGSPGESLGDITSCGEVHVLYGSFGTGLSAADDQRWNQGTEGIDGIVEISDGFGFTLSIGDFDGDGAADLAINARDEDVGDVQSAGQINVIYGLDEIGLTAIGDQVWHQNIAGVPGILEEFERFGLGLP